MKYMMQLVLAPLVLTAPGSAQEEVELLSKTVVFRSIDESDEDFRDLEPLVSLIGSARVVQLAEDNHGDGSSFRARSRMIRFLHQRMQFDVIVFESPFVAMRDVNEALSSTAPLDDVLGKGLYACWGISKQMRALFQYVRATRETGSPIDVVGCDAQISGTRESGRLAARLSNFLGRDPVAFNNAEAIALSKVVDAMRIDSGVRPSGAEFASQVRVLQRAHYALTSPTERLAALTSPLEREWHTRALATLMQTVEGQYLRAMAAPFTGDFAAYALEPSVHAGQNRRDRAMADNILWYYQRAFSGRKIIVWAANSHSQTEERGWVEGNDNFPSVRVSTLGRYLAGMLGGDLFTMLSTAYEGSGSAPSKTTADGTHIWTTWDIKPAVAGSLEHRLHQAGVQYGVVDIRGMGLRVKDVRIELNDDESILLDRFCDAILFIDQMEPSGSTTKKAD